MPAITVSDNAPPGEGYKGIAYLFMGSAAVSYSMLAPTDSCGNLHSQYMSVIDIAISSSSLRAISEAINPATLLFFIHLLPNIHNLKNSGAGTDHAWGGNHFILGGSNEGGKIHSDLT